MSRLEFHRALRIVVPMTLGTMAVGYCAITVLLYFFIGFQHAQLHYLLATLFPVVLTPATILPFALLSQRLRAAKHELEAQLRIDTMTGLPNRRAFFEKATIMFGGGSAVALMMIDVDHFKEINDRFGHEGGDAVIRALARSIDAAVQGAPCGCARMTARLGGEEFAVLLPGCDRSEACRLADHIIARLGRTPTLYGGRSIAATVSIGLAERRAGEGVDDTLRAADNACYRAKRLGRNQWRAADDIPDRATFGGGQGAVRLRPNLPPVAG
jgi:diguanylate cyclase (GGDEF)-like protein